MLEEFNIFSLLLFLLSGGGKDLVSYIPPDAFWDAKGVEVVSVDALLPELAPPKKSEVDLDKAIVALGSADPAEREKAAKALLAVGPGAIAELEKEAASPDVEVARRARSLVAQIRSDAKPREIRRLMTIRSLGHLKDAKALPTLKELSASTEPFVADYANVAMATIEGKPAPPPHPLIPKALSADVGLLPASCAAVVQFKPGPGLAPPFEDAIAKLQLPEPAREMRLRQLSAELITTAERYGNVRVDALTLGVSGDFTGEKGYVVAIVRGQFDPDVAAVVARQEKFASSPVGGQTVFQWGPESRVFFPSADRAVFVAAPDAQDAAVAELVAAVAKGTGTIRENADLAKLLDAADASRPVWGVAKLTPALQAMPFLDGLDILRLTGVQNGETLDLKLAAAGPDPARVRTSATLAEAALRENLPTLEKLAVFMPPLRPARDLVNSVRLTPAANGTVVGSATWSGSVTSLYVFSMYPFTLPADVPKE